MAPICELCNEADSKYKCPTCGLKYCSIACYKPHKTAHEAEQAGQKASITETVRPTRVDRPGTTQRVAKPKFDGFESDDEFKRLLLRYPALKTQLQGVFGLTLDPGPEQARSWNKLSLPMLDRPSNRGRGGRDRMGGRGRGHGARGGRVAQLEPPDGREHGQWTREKGDREALHVMKKLQTDVEDEILSEGMQEFVELIRIRFGDRQDDAPSADTAPVQQ